MRAGELNSQITFQRCSTAYVDHEPSETWADAFTVWAAVITDGGKEFYAAQKKHSETTAVFKIRYRGDVKATMRIKYGNSIYEILSPVNDVGGKHTEMLISGKEVI